MKKEVLLVGGFHKTMYLAQSLLDKGYGVTVINNIYEDCMALAQIEKLNIIYGDGTKPFVLEEAEAHLMDIAIALTKKDEDNLVICELCKKRFHIQKTLSLVNDPQKIDFFYQMGIDSVVNAISTVSRIIEQQAFVDEMTEIVSVDDNRVNIMEIKVKDNMPINKKKLYELSLPENSIIGYILRNNQGIVPRGDTRILEGDKLIVICSKNNQEAIIKEMTGQ